MGQSGACHQTLRIRIIGRVKRRSSHRQTFDGADSLRKAAEAETKRILTDDEWQTVDPDGSYSQPHNAYDEADLADLVDAIESVLPHLARPSAAERQRKQALAHVQRTAVEAKSFVEELRVSVFGKPRPPFESDGAAAAKWIEARVNQKGSVAFLVTVDVPMEQADDLNGLLWLKDWLTAAFHGRERTDESILRELRARGSPLRQIGAKRQTLHYLAPDNGEWIHRRVYALNNTDLGKLREAADKLSDATGWDQLAACHHLLTGGVMSSPVKVTPQIRLGRLSFGGPKITIEVPNPQGVRVDEIAKAYADARRELVSHPFAGARGQRSTISAKREKLVAFVAESNGLTWRQRLPLWNKRHPEFAYQTADAMRLAFRRAQ